MPQSNYIVCLLIFITMWDEFVKVFLKKYNHIHKIATIKKMRLTYRSSSKGTLFEVYGVKRSCSLLPPLWICKIAYEGLNYMSKTFFWVHVSKKHMKKNENEIWEFQKDLVWKTMRWIIHAEKSSAFTAVNKGGIHTIDSSITALICIIEALEIQVHPLLVMQFNWYSWVL